MPPYQYAPITSPFVGSIADTMQRPAQALAAAEIAKGNAWAQAAQGIGQAASGAIQQATDPRRQLEQQQVDSNKRALAYQTTATTIAKSLVGPNGEQPTPEVASAAMTRLGVPIENQQGILKSLESGANHQKESLADAGHIAYQAMKGLPPGASDDDRAHAASAALGASMAGGFITPEQSKQVTGMLAQGANPMGMALAVMGQSPSKRFGDILQNETKPLIVPGAPRPGATPSTVMVGGKTVATGAQPGPAPLTPEQVALDAATVGTPQETPTAKQSAAAVALTHPKTTGTAEQDDQRYRNLVAAQQLNKPIAPEDAAWMKGYVAQKTIGIDRSASVAADRQARTIAEQNALTKQRQDFEQAQAGRKELTEKVEQPLQTALGSAQTLRDVVSAAKAGNKVAASLQPLETTMSAIRAQGLNRINSAEIGVTQNAGSLYDNIVGRLGKLAGGEPVPADLQKDMTDFAGILEKAAYKKYSDAWDSTVPRYKLADEKKLPPPGAPADGETRTVNGVTRVWGYHNGQWGWALK